MLIIDTINFHSKHLESLKIALVLINAQAL